MNLDLTAARAAANVGISRAQQSADNAHKDWTTRAYEYFVGFAARGVSFMTEDVRVVAEEDGLPPPPDKRAWGAVARKAQRAGLVKMLGYGPQRSVNAHGAPKAIWLGRDIRAVL